MRHGSRRDTRALQMRLNLVFLIIVILCLLSINVKGEIDYYKGAKVEAMINLRNVSTENIFDIRDKDNNRVALEDLKPGGRYYVRMFIGDKHRVDLSAKSGSVPYGFGKDKSRYELEGVSIYPLSGSPHEAITAEAGYSVLKITDDPSEKVKINLAYTGRDETAASDILYTGIFKFERQFNNDIKINPKVIVEKLFHDMSRNNPASATYVISQKYDTPLESFELKDYSGKRLLIDFSRTCNKFLKEDSQAGRQCKVGIKSIFDDKVKGTITLTKVDGVRNGRYQVKVNITAEPSGKEVLLGKNKSINKIIYSKDFVRQNMHNDPRYNIMRLIFGAQVIARNSQNQDQSRLYLVHSEDDWGSDGDFDGGSDYPEDCFDKRTGKYGIFYPSMALGEVNAQLKVFAQEDENGVRVDLEGSHRLRMNLSLIRRRSRPYGNGVYIVDVRRNGEFSSPHEVARMLVADSRASGGYFLAYEKKGYSTGGVLTEYRIVRNGNSVRAEAQVAVRVNESLSPIARDSSTDDPFYPSSDSYSYSRKRSFVDRLDSKYEDR